MNATPARTRLWLCALVVGCALLAAFAPPPAVAQSRTVLIYSPLHEITIASLTRVFYTSTGQTVEFVRMPAAEIVARVVAEKARPRADVVLGLSAAMQEELRRSGVLDRYLSPARADVPTQFRDADGYWTGTTVHVQGITVNVDRYRKEFPGVRFPRTYDDLLEPRLRGHIVAPNPTTSGAGFTFTITQITRLGEERAWEYLAAFDKNVRFYTSGSSTPANVVAAGEFPVAISYAHDAEMVLRDGRPIRFLYPPKAGWEMTAVSVVKGAPNSEGAQRFADWLLSHRAQDLMTKISLAYPVRLDVALPKGVTPLKELDLVSYDVKIASIHRARVAREWTRRFGAAAAGK